jgi:protoporphyrin/coproporphyrin ferrochelatase
VQVRLAVVLFNLGGPDSLEAVEPFLRNLFGDPAILSVPSIVRGLLGAFIARRRAPVARKIYEKLGGCSPILGETLAQATALEEVLAGRGVEARCFVAMRYWHPFAQETACEVKAWGADKVVLLPLYPQFSTTTTGSSFDDWADAARRVGLDVPTMRLCCYAEQRDFIGAEVAFIQDALTRAKSDVDYRLLFSAHGLPKRTVAKGDPYQWQVERTAAAIAEALGLKQPDWVVCYQSRVGPLEWIGPATDAEIRRAGADGKGVVIVPIAFVSEHSETLVELDIEYRHLAERAGVPDYIRVPTVGVHPKFVAGLGDLVIQAAGTRGTTCAAGRRVCPAEFGCCRFGGN